MIKVENGDVIFETTGRKEYTFGVDFTPNDENGILYGSDGGIDNLTDSERAEVANYMIGRWQRWLRREEIFK